MTKILVYFNSMHPSGGIERVIATLCNKLSANYEITILVKDEPYSFYKLNDNIVMHTLNNELKFDMKSRFNRFFTALSTIISNTGKLRKYLKQNDYDYYYLAHPLNVLEFSLAGAENNKIIITEHGAKSAYNRIYRTVKNLLYKKCIAYVVPAKSDVADYQNDGLPAIYIPHFRSDLPYTDSLKVNKIVLNIGRFTADKQQLALLEIWEEVIQSPAATGWVLQIAGKGELENELHNFVIEKNLQRSVEFLAPTKHVEQYYKNASIFALTSSSEGFGMVLLEAISFGLPCVSYDCPSGPRDIITSGKNGYLVELNNKNQFKEQLLSLIQNEQSLKDMGEKAMESSIGWNDSAVLSNWFSLFK